MRKTLNLVLLAGLTVVSAQSSLRAESIVDVNALQSEVSAFEQKASAIQDGNIRSGLEAAIARFRSTTSRLVQMAGPIDALTSKEELLKEDLKTKSAAMKHFQEVKKQSTSDLDRWLEAWDKSVAVHNANLPTFTEEQQAEAAAFTARVNAENAEKDRKLAERKQIQERLDAENKPVVEAYLAAFAAVPNVRREKGELTQALFTEYKTWQEQQVWLNAAVDVASSGTNPADALMPFPGGGVASSGAGLAARHTVPAGTNVDAGAQLKSVARHSAAAAATGDREESGKGFDTSGKEAGSLVYAGGSAGRPAPAFVSKLPDTAKNDDGVKQSLAWYQHLEALKEDTARKISALEEEQKTGKGDAAILAAKIGTLANQIKQNEADQANAKESVKKRVKDLGFDWNE